jgi:hypothetical protein
VCFCQADRVWRVDTCDGSCRFNHKGASVITALSCGARHGIMSRIMRLLIVLLLVLPFAASSAATLTGRTVRVTDGDTIVILSEGNVQHKIRLQGIDAPERRQAYGTKSKEHLSEWVAGRFVVVETDKRDRYGRGVQRAFHGEQFGTEQEHAHWISLADKGDMQSHERGRGYLDGLSS